MTEPKPAYSIDDNLARFLGLQDVSAIRAVQAGAVVIRCDQSDGKLRLEFIPDAPAKFIVIFDEKGRRVITMNLDADLEIELPLPPAPEPESVEGRVIVPSLSIRNEPSTTGLKLGGLVKDAVIEIYEVQEIGGYTWVRHNAGGWSAAREGASVYIEYPI